LFTDKYSKLTKDPAGTKTEIKLFEDKIAWETDKMYKFKNIKSYQKGTATEPTEGDEVWKDIQWTDMEDDHFIVWMRYAGLPTFRKLWARIEEPLTVGDYSIIIDNYYDVEPFEGKKSIVFSTTNSLGGKSYKLAICFFIAGGFTALYFFYLLFKINQSR